MGVDEFVWRYAPMARQDVEAVMEVERRCFGSPWTPGQFRHELRVPFSRTVLAWQDRGQEQHLAGYVCRWAVGEEFSILNLAVDPGYQRRGLGRALVELVLSEAEEKQACLVTLEVRENNDAARALYGTLGFLQTGMRRDYYAKSEHAIIMTKSLVRDVPREEPLCPSSGRGV